MEHFVQGSHLQVAPLLLELAIRVLVHHDLPHPLVECAQRSYQLMNGLEDAQERQEVNDDQGASAHDDENPEFPRYLQVEAERFGNDAQGQGVRDAGWLSLVCRSEVQVLDYHGCVLAVAREVDGLRGACIRQRFRLVLRLIKGCFKG